jgi:hypothetical protein
VDEQTQKSRDGDRRRILENELAAEEKNAEQAKKDLAEQEAIVLPNERMQGGAISGGKVQERLQPYKDKVALASAQRRGNPERDRQSALIFGA